MHKSKVHSPSEALLYLTDCSLATVSGMAMKKSRPQHEYQRQVAIAQTAVDWIREFGIDAEGTRAQDVIAAGGSVASWTAQYDIRLAGLKK